MSTAPKKADYVLHLSAETKVAVSDSCDFESRSGEISSVFGGLDFRAAENTGTPQSHRRFSISFDRDIASGQHTIGAPGSPVYAVHYLIHTGDPVEQNLIEYIGQGVMTVTVTPLGNNRFKYEFTFSLTVTANDGDTLSFAGSSTICIWFY